MRIFSIRNHFLVLIITILMLSLPAMEAVASVHDLPVIELNATTETPAVLNSAEGNYGDADDPAIWVHPRVGAASLVIATKKNAGLGVYDLSGVELQSIAPLPEEGALPAGRFNNVDILYGFPLGAKRDIAVVSDRGRDTVRIFQINPGTLSLKPIKVLGFDHLFSSPNALTQGKTAYGLTTWHDKSHDHFYVFVSQADGALIRQLRLHPADSTSITMELVRTIILPEQVEINAISHEIDNPTVEGMVVDQNLGWLYVGQEEVGIWRYSTDPDTKAPGVLVDRVISLGGEHLVADVEGLAILYGSNPLEDSGGYLIASSQGDDSFSIYSRLPDTSGAHTWIGRFRIVNDSYTDGVQHCDGIEIIRAHLGDSFPEGLMVVQDGSNAPNVVVYDEKNDEYENINTNFKFVSLKVLDQAINARLTIRVNANHAPR